MGRINGLLNARSLSSIVKICTVVVSIITKKNVKGLEPIMGYAIYGTLKVVSLDLEVNTGEITTLGQSWNLVESYPQSRCT